MLVPGADPVQESITYRGTNSYSSILAIGLLAYPAGCVDVIHGTSSVREVRRQDRRSALRRHVRGTL